MAHNINPSSVTADCVTSSWKCLLNSEVLPNPFLYSTKVLFDRVCELEIYDSATDGLRRRKKLFKCHLGPLDVLLTFAGHVDRSSRSCILSSCPHRPYYPAKVCTRNFRPLFRTLAILAKKPCLSRGVYPQKMKGKTLFLLLSREHLHREKA